MKRPQAPSGPVGTERDPHSGEQIEGQLNRFNTLTAVGVVDVIQPNVVICDGLTAGTKAVALAGAHNVELANGGTFLFHNIQLNGGPMAWHMISAGICRQHFTGLFERQGEILTFPDLPGVGFEADSDALLDFAARPGSRGRSKG